MDNRPDHWGRRARIGMFIVGNEAVPEAEWWAMCPPDVSIHAARVTAPSPWARWDDQHRDVVLEADLERGVRQFSNMRLSAIVVGHSSSSIVGGAGWDAAVVSRLAESFSGEVFVTTNGRDCAAAMTASAVRRPFVVFPPWYGEDLAALGVEYFRQLGFEPAGHLRHDAGPGWRHLAPGELYPAGYGFAQDVEALYGDITATCPKQADGVLVAGTGFRCVGIIAALEQSLSRPVISANQASLWRCLRHAGVATPVEGYGKLLSRRR